MSYNLGTIKLTWIDSCDYDYLNSMMFDSVEQALEASKDKCNFLLMELVEDKCDLYYKWKLLPYGSYKEYLTSMQIKKSNLVLVFSICILLLAFFGLVKLFE